MVNMSLFRFTDLWKHDKRVRLFVSPSVYPPARQSVCLCACVCVVESIKVIMREMLIYLEMFIYFSSWQHKTEESLEGKNFHEFMNMVVRDKTPE